MSVLTHLNRQTPPPIVVIFKDDNQEIVFFQNVIFALGTKHHCLRNSIYTYYTFKSWCYCFADKNKKLYLAPVVRTIAHVLCREFSLRA